jgi:hypothetical protein
MSPTIYMIGRGACRSCGILVVGPADRERPTPTAGTGKLEKGQR